MSRVPSLGRLERVPVRKAWDNEATSFTPWLAQEENLGVLSETLEMDLAVVGIEASVGSFRADIVCQDQSSDQADDQLVLIENQLERTDHTHLGQLLTYAAGLQTVTLVWIADRFTEPHRAALDWLNEITDERFRFFGLEVELWRIGESQMAPKFNIVSKPNSWSKTVHGERRGVGTGVNTDLKQAQLGFWTQLSDILGSSPGNLMPRTPKALHYYGMPIGRTGFSMNAYFLGGRKKIEVDLYLSQQNAHRNFELLKSQKAELEAELGQLQWIKASKEARIAQSREVDEPLNEENWPEMLSWIIERLIVFDKSFRERVRSLPQ